jgi:hypothetical protein
MSTNHIIGVVVSVLASSGRSWVRVLVGYKDYKIGISVLFRMQGLFSVLTYKWITKMRILHTKKALKLDEK